MKHWHHIVPKHIGGSDEPDNLVLLTVEEHAEAHRLLWEQYGRWQDKIAWKTLSGQIDIQEARHQMMKHDNPMRKKDVIEKMSGDNHWSKRKQNEGKKLFGNINAMHLPEVVEKRSGDNHWSKKPGKIHNAISNHPKGSSKKITIFGKTYESIKKASEELQMGRRKIKKIGKMYG
jgi:predicted transcriptional regulator